MTWPLVLAVTAGCGLGTVTVLRLAPAARRAYRELFADIGRLRATGRLRK